MNAPNLFPDRPDERLDAWLDDALTPDEARAVAARVANDPDWADAARAARRLRDALAAAPLPTAPPDFRARVFAALPPDAQRAEQPRAVRMDADRPPVPHRRRLVRIAAGMVAAVALFATGVYVTRPAPSPVYTSEDVADARADVEWTLAYLNRLNAQTAAHVSDALPALPQPDRAR